MHRMTKLSRKIAKRHGAISAWPNKSIVTHMKKIQNLTLFAFFILALSGCGSTEKTGLEEKQAKLEEYKIELAETQAKIADLEREIAALGGEAEESGSASILVSAQLVKQETFVHKVEARGAVESRKNVTLSAETMGRVESISVTEGQDVSRGQLLLKLDADILENNISEVKTQLELAQAIHKRQANLWEQNIGTEIQYLEAKNTMESLQRRLATLNSQLDQAYVKAPFDGVVDYIPVKVGEMAQPGLPLVRIVNQNEMYIKADVSEVYLGKFRKSDTVEIYFPTQDITVSSKIASVGRVINEMNRTFTVEVSIPQDGKLELRPNQVAVLRLTDYVNPDAIAVPTRVIQSDDQGKYIFTLDTADGKKVAKKVRVTTGKSFANRTEILSGLTGNEQVINEGYRDVNEGAEVSL